MKMARAVMAPADLTAARIGEIAAGGAQPGSAAPGLGVRLGPELLAGVQRQCEQARAELRRGHPVYGVNTGMGALSGVRLTEAEQLVHQRRLMLARATGGPPWLDAADVQAIYRGPAAQRSYPRRQPDVSTASCQRLADFPAEGIISRLPKPHLA